jgi:hypothetical protein
MTKTSDVRAEMARWVKEASAHSVSVESHDGMTEAEARGGDELADEAEGLAERAKAVGAGGIKLAQAFGLLRKSWMDTGLPPVAIQQSCALAARIG